MTARKILLATRNAHKTAEFRAILGAGWEVTDLQAHPDFPEVEETGETFAENAALKAVAASSRLDAETFVLADDSGLAVDALGGAPGVHSARYAAEPGTSGNSDDAANRHKLIGELSRLDVTAETGSPARFVCHITVARGRKIRCRFRGHGRGARRPGRTRRRRLRLRFALHPGGSRADLWRTSGRDEKPSQPPRGGAGESGSLFARASVNPLTGGAASREAAKIF